MNVREHFLSEISLANGYHRRDIAPGRIKEYVESNFSRWQYWFVLTFEGEKWLGRKFMVDATGRRGVFSIIRPWMLLGRKESIVVEGRGAIFRYRTVSTALAYEAFARAALDPRATIDFPFPCLDDRGREFIVPAESWSAGTPLTKALDSHERHFREHAVEKLTDGLAPGAFVYAPACSTGAFIGQIAKSFPHVRCVGSDISADMISLAAQRYGDDNLDFQVANAAEPCTGRGTCDALFVRFLNAEVVSQSNAVTYFQQIALLLRKGGRMFVFGHTPILFRPADYAASLGLKSLSGIGQRPGDDGLFQFHVLEAVR